MAYQALLLSWVMFRSARAQHGGSNVTDALAPSLPAFSTDSIIQLSDATQPWQCHVYGVGQSAPDWCAKAGIQDGYEYGYFEGGVGGPCAPCWCCKRKVEITTTVATTTMKPQEAIVKTTNATSKYAREAIAVHGIVGATILAGGGGSVDGDALTLRHNSGFTLFSKFEGSWEPENILQLQLLGKTISFTVDLSHVGCACNLAFYLIGAPARGQDGHFSAGTNRGGQPPYYCDANQVGGQWCPEVDIMEANNHAFQATMHKCDAPNNGVYNFCDRGGCDQSTRDRVEAYGPGSEYTIDTRQAFDVHTSFLEEASNLVGMRTVLKQGASEVVLEHSNCDSGYLSKLSDVMASGMSLRITYWGDKAETMSWMDSPPCGAQACSGSNAGHAVIRNMSVSSVSKGDMSLGQTTASTTPSWGAAPLPSWDAPTTTQKPEAQMNYSDYPIQVNGLPGKTVLAGGGGDVDGSELTLRHNSGFSLFSKYEGSWEPENLVLMKLLGKTISFTVDLSQVGCACNLAFYLIGAPARSWDGKYSPGTNRGGQPPYYCDANQVGGQWCPEIDIMEANNRAFQATLHKCDAPSNGVYSSCDRGGCDESTRDRIDSYGPGEQYTIDTRQAFEVQTSFLEDASVLTGMKTVLRQGASEVVLDHSNCDREYVSKLSEVLANGMSLRITYWGDKADTMAWMDSPPCGAQVCTGGNAGHATIRNISVGSLKSEKQQVWVVDDARDELNGKIVPQKIIDDNKRFAFLADQGIVRWRGATHYVAQKSSKDCDDQAGGSPCEVNLSEEEGFMHMFAKKYDGLHVPDLRLMGWKSGASVIPVGVAGIALASLLLLGVRRVRRHASLRGFGSSKQASDVGHCAAPPTTKEATVQLESGVLPRWQAHPPASQQASLARSNSSCLSLLGLMDAINE